MAALLKHKDAKNGIHTFVIEEFLIFVFSFDDCLTYLYIFVYMGYMCIYTFKGEGDVEL